jgi:hypothetical protein
MTAAPRVKAFDLLPADFNPRYATVPEVCAFTRLSRTEIERRLRDGVYESFLASRQKRLVVFSTVLEDIERRRKEGARFGLHVGEGRGGSHKRKAEAEAPAAEG